MMITVAYILIAVGGIVSLVGMVILLIAAFRVSLGWGLALLFLSWLVVPFVVFLVKYWSEARTGFLISIGGWILTGIGWFVFAGSIASMAMAEFENFEIQEPESADTPLFETTTESGEWNDEETATSGVLFPTEIPAPSPTPTPMAAEEYEELQESLAESAAKKKIITFEQAREHIGEYVRISLADGSSATVTIDSISQNRLQITQRVGGGAVSYSVHRNNIKELRLLN
jgi:hypothetical protein